MFSTLCFVNRKSLLADQLLNELFEHGLINTVFLMSQRLKSLFHLNGKNSLRYEVSLPEPRVYKKCVPFVYLTSSLLNNIIKLIINQILSVVTEMLTINEWQSGR